MSDSPDMLIGTAVDERYFVEDLVRRGRGGLLYRARHMVLQHAVMLKVVHRELIERGCSLRTLREEAMASALIKSAHALTVSDFGLTVDQRAYYALDWLEGHTLDATLREGGPLSEGHVVALLEQLEDVLSEMHGHGVVHCAVRPDNIFVTKRRGRDFVKLLGVGMGTLAAVSEPPSAYTSPEQRLGDPLDQRADVFSLAVTAYEMVTGSLPFAGVDMMTHRGGPPSIRERDASISQTFASAVACALDDAPAERFDSVAAFVDALTPQQQVVVKGTTKPVSVRQIDDPERFVATLHAPLSGEDLPPAPVMAKMRARAAAAEASADAARRQQIVMAPGTAAPGVTAAELDDEARTGQHVPHSSEVPTEQELPAVQASSVASAAAVTDDEIDAEPSTTVRKRPRDPAGMARPVDRAAAAAATITSASDAMGEAAPERTGSINVDRAPRRFGPASAEVQTLRNVPSVEVDSGQLDAAEVAAARAGAEAAAGDDAAEIEAAEQQAAEIEAAARTQPLQGARPGSTPLAAITLARVSANEARRRREAAVAAARAVAPERPEAMTLKEAPAVLPPGSKTLLSTPLERSDAARASGLAQTSSVELDGDAHSMPTDDDLDAIDSNISVPAPLPLAEVEGMDELDAIEAEELDDGDDDDAALGGFIGEPRQQAGGMAFVASAERVDNSKPIVEIDHTASISSSIDGLAAGGASAADASAVSSAGAARASGEIDRTEASAALAEIEAPRVSPKTDEVQTLGEPYSERRGTEVVRLPRSRSRPFLIVATLVVLLGVGAFAAVRLVSRARSTTAAGSAESGSGVTRTAGGATTAGTGTGSASAAGEKAAKVAVDAGAAKVDASKLVHGAGSASGSGSGTGSGASGTSGARASGSATGTSAGTAASAAASAAARAAKAKVAAAARERARARRAREREREKAAADRLERELRRQAREASKASGDRPASKTPPDKPQPTKPQPTKPQPTKPAAAGQPEKPTQGASKQPDTKKKPPSPDKTAPAAPKAKTPPAKPPAKAPAKAPAKKGVKVPSWAK